MFLPTTALCLCLYLSSSSAARVLGIFPTPSISHQLPFQAVMKALAARGHQVTVLSTDPLKTPHANHTDIDLSFTYEFWAQFDFSQTNEAPPWKMMKIFTGTGKDICRMQLSSKEVQDFLKAGCPAWSDIAQRVAKATHFGRTDHRYKLQCRGSRTNIEKYSFLSTAAKLWNDLPECVVEPWPDNVKVLKEPFCELASPRFDVVFIESLFFQCYYGLIHRLGSPPIIGLLSIGGISAMFDAVGGPNNPAYDPDMAIPYSDHMTFIQRLHNTLYSYWIRYHWYYELMVEQEAIMREFFGDDPPTVWETERNFSMMMVNNHWSMNYVRPTMPAYVELGSLHLQTETKPLPEDLKKFLDGAKDGFIYFSLGSNIRSDKMPAAKQAEFLAAFAQLKPLRVLWKWESESLPGQSDNVKLMKWLPQQDVLAHPNIRLFITQGGLQSFQEAVHSAVPTVGIPFLADQRQNVQKMIISGIGKKLDFEEITRENILNTIKAVVYEPSYRESMQKMSAINKDQPQTPIERAVWWTEYVIRHKGAKHLRAASLDLAWYQYLLLDVFAALLAALAVTVYVVFVISRFVYRLIICKTCKSKKTDKKVLKKGVKRD